MVEFASVQEFTDSLDEVDVLLTLAGEATRDGNTERLNVLLKSAVVLVTGKFESFIETVVEDYIYNYNQLKIPAANLPIALKIFHSLQIVKDPVMNHLHLQERFAEAEKAFSNLSSLWSSPSYPQVINISSKFSYGKHGEKEIANLFARIGIDIFSFVTLEEEKPSMLSDTIETVKVDFKGVLNSITAIRNNILHEDASPSFTIEEVQRFKILFNNFANLLERNLRASISEVQDSYRISLSGSYG